MNETVLLTLFIIFSATAAIQLFYYLWFYLAPFVVKKAERTTSKPAVSVIICARNEAANLEKFLPSVLEQDYPEFEVIVVNDCSEDETDEVLGRYLVKYPNLRISTISKDPKFTHNKKFAQFIGIKAATHDVLLFTDADCQPCSPGWISGMVSALTPGKEFVLGYGGYINRKGLLNKYIRYETLFIGMQYLGMAVRGIPYMGVGRNLAYKKDVFFRNRGFGQHYHIISGDDDLFVNANAGKKNTATEFSYPSHTRSVAAGSVEAWVKQKRRHLTTAKYYKFRHKILLVTEPAARILFYTLFIILMAWLWMWQWVLGIFLFRSIVQLTINHIAGRKLNERGLTFFSLFFDIFSPLINIALYTATFRYKGSSITWK